MILDLTRRPGWHYNSLMTNLYDLTTSQLNRIIAIKERIEKLQGELAAIAGDSQEPAPSAPSQPKARRMSAAGRARIAAAARSRWARVKGAGAMTSEPAPKGKRRLSAAGRAAIIAGTKARWAREKGLASPGKTTAGKTDRRTSPAVKAKLAAIARARWAKIKAAGKTSL
jgi:hypothetical protein